MSDALRRALGQSQADLELLASHLSLIQEMLDASDHAISREDLCARLTKVFVAELGFEQVVLFCCPTPGEVELVARSSQTERFGGPAGPLPGCLAGLARQVIAEKAVIRWGGQGVGLRRRLPAELEGSVVGVPLESRGHELGALIGLDLAVRRWTLARQRALEVVGRIVGRIVATTEARFTLDALHHDLEIELSTAGARLRRQEASLREHAGKIQSLSSSLASASRVRDTFLGLLSHELRTPVAAIIGYAAMLQEGGGGPTTDEQHDILGRIEANGRHLGRLLEDMLFLTEAESARIEPRFEAVELSRVVDEIAGAVPRFKEPGAPGLEVSIAKTAARTETDPRLLGRALFHLLEHVVGRSAAGVRIDVGQESDAIRIGLHGAGPATSAHPAPRTDAPTADDEAHEVKSSLRLGLVRLCMALLGGRYTLAARADGGASAELWLPTRGPEPSPERPENSALRGRSDRAKRSARPPAAAGGGRALASRFLHPHWRSGSAPARRAESASSATPRRARSRSRS